MSQLLLVALALVAVALSRAKMDYGTVDERGLERQRRREAQALQAADLQAQIQQKAMRKARERQEEEVRLLQPNSLRARTARHTRLLLLRRCATCAMPRTWRGSTARCLGRDRRAQGSRAGAA